MPADGLIALKSAYTVKETVDRLESVLKAKGMTVFARIDHAAGAMQAGLVLRPTELLIFGSPEAGTSLMQADQAVAIDLPLKALAWCDAAGTNWLAYNDPHWIAARHGLDAAAGRPAEAMSAALAILAKDVTGN